MADQEEADELNAESEAQSEATIMPWLMGAMSLLVVAAFVAWMVFGTPLHQTRQPPGAAPVTRPINQHT